MPRYKRYKYMFLLLVCVGLLVLGGLSRCQAMFQDSGEQLVEYHAETYYVSSEYLETGDETIEPLSIMGRKIEIPAKDADQIYAITLAYLSEPVRDLEDTMVKEGMIRGVTVTDGVAVVDFNGEMMHGGSLEEVYLIEQVVRTLIKSFDEVQKVRFTVDGSEVDSLMGHLEANCTYGLITVQEEGSEVELVSIMED